MIRGCTFKFLANLVVAQKPGKVATYEAIHQVLQEYYKPRPTKIAKRFRFYRRNQQLSETVAMYLAELRWLASTCKFDDFQNEALCDRLACM